MVPTQALSALTRSTLALDTNQIFWPLKPSLAASIQRQLENAELSLMRPFQISDEEMNTAIALAGISDPRRGPPFPEAFTAILGDLLALKDAHKSPMHRAKNGLQPM